VSAIVACGLAKAQLASSAAGQPAVSFYSSSAILAAKHQRGGWLFWPSAVNAALPAYRRLCAGPRLADIG